MSSPALYPSNTPSKPHSPLSYQPLTKPPPPSLSHSILLPRLLTLKRCSTTLNPEPLKPIATSPLMSPNPSQDPFNNSPMSTSPIKSAYPSTSYPLTSKPCTPTLNSTPLPLTPPHIEYSEPSPKAPSPLPLPINIYLPPSSLRSIDPLNPYPSPITSSCSNRNPPSPADPLTLNSGYTPSPSYLKLIPSKLIPQCPPSYQPLALPPNLITPSPIPIPKLSIPTSPPTRPPDTSNTPLHSFPTSTLTSPPLIPTLTSYLIPPPLTSPENNSPPYIPLPLNPIS